MRERTCYQCEFCGKILLTKISMYNHERICFHNPERKACAICTYPYYLIGDERTPFTGESKRTCKKGHNIEKTLRADCGDFLWSLTAGSWGWYTQYHYKIIEKQENCKHSTKEYLSGDPAETIKICRDCEKIF